MPRSVEWGIFFLWHSSKWGQADPNFGEPVPRQKEYGTMFLFSYCA